MIQPQTCRIEYYLGDEPDANVCVAEFDISDVQPIRTTEDLTLLVEFTDEIFVVRAVTQKPMTVTKCRVEYGFQFEETDRMLINGYQSWTDTQEVSPWRRGRGLLHVPDEIKRRFVLDGSGDYRFSQYKDEEGVLHGWTYGYLRRKYYVIFVGSVDESDGFTRLGVNTTESLIYSEKEPPARKLGIGDGFMIANMALVVTKGSTNVQVDVAHAHWLELAGIRRRPAQPITGYNSWYRHYDKINHDKLLNDLYGTCRGLEGMDLADHNPVFLVDDGYARVGDWLDIYEDKFPAGLNVLASAASEAGLTPGIWCAPFVCEADSDVFCVNSDWLLRDENGDLVKTGSHWSGGYALDTRNPEVREYVRDVLQTITQEWGFRLLKLDFLFAACMIPHDGMNRGELMADAMNLLRSAVGDDISILACGVPLGSAFGTVEYCRIGCDVGLDWDGKLFERMLERERVSTRNSLANTVYRAPLNGRVFLSDPDVLLLRDSVDLTDEQRALLAEADGCFGGMVLTSDDMSGWDEAKRQLFQEVLRTQAGMLRMRGAL